MDFSKRIIVSITGFSDMHWRNKLDEINKFKLKKVALFLSQFVKSKREQIYSSLLDSNIEEIPLVHLRHDMVKNEIKFFIKNFNTKYFTIHEECFNFLERWRGFYNRLYLEMDTDNFIPKKVDISRVGGFCIDLSHFKVEEKKQMREFDYIMKRKNHSGLFACSHLNGYSYKSNTDLHRIRTLKDFDYLKTIPQFLFGKVIALENLNSISEQLKYKKYLVKFLNK